jgi:peptidoglycan/LPS O-acetylase OafA/YrhL
MTLTQKNRYDFLDLLRFIAAFSVLIQHVFEKLSPSFVIFSTNYFQFGVFGVTLFFLCSGFIIPVSLEKQQSIKKFWISRFFRLFPLYYLSIVSTLIFSYFGFFSGSIPSLKIILINLTMLQRLLGQPSLLGLYWTLSLEMLFYIIVSALFIFKLNKTFANAIIALLASFLIGVVCTHFFHFFQKGWGTIFSIASMFVGSVYFKNIEKQIPNKKLILILILAFIALISITFFNLYKKDQPQYLGTLSFIPVTTSLVMAYFIFSLFYYFRNITFNKILIKLGIFSYSIYLIQGSILGLIPEIRNNPFATVVIWIGSTLVISFFTYTYIEKPAIQYGRSIIKGKIN